MQLSSTVAINQKNYSALEAQNHELSEICGEFQNRVVARDDEILYLKRLIEERTIFAEGLNGRVKKYEMSEDQISKLEEQILLWEKRYKVDMEDHLTVYIYG